MQRWSVVVPAKRLAVAKTRLHGGAAVPDDHAGLVLALLGDTVAAAAAASPVQTVWVVTDEPAAAAVAAGLGARVVADEPDAGLNAALAFGAVAARAAGARWVAALHSDLPALRPAELAAALDRAAVVDRAFVADASGTGTTLLAATTGDLRPAFGGGSAAAHARSGAQPLTGAWPGLRRDVDTAEDLAAVQALGVGPRTAALLAGRPAPGACA